MSLAVETDMAPPLHTISKHASNHDQMSTFQAPDARQSESPPPMPRPPVSPISPSASIAQPASAGAAVPEAVNTVMPPQNPAGKPKKQKQKPQQTQIPARPKPPPQTQFIDPPAPVALDIDDNTDAAALRAAISILQIQREKSKQDIKTLQKLKHGLVKDPDNFTQELLSGKLREEKLPNDPLQATFNATNDKDDVEDEELGDPAETKTSTVDQTNSPTSAASQYPKIPSAQNVVRCPPVNWAKYHIAGEPLNRMHEEQRRMPTANEPARDGSIQQQAPYSAPAVAPTSEHKILAPFDPHKDKITTAPDHMGVGAQPKRKSDAAPASAI